MKLAEFLQKTVQTGHDRYRLTSEARGTEIARGELAKATADELEDLARADAALLPREPLHTYVLIAESSDGAKLTRLPIRVPGGQSANDEHRVDAASTQTPGAVIGHLTRLVIEQAKSNAQVVQTLMNKIIDRDIDESREVNKLRRQLARRGDKDLDVKIIELHTEAERAQRAEVHARWEQMFKLAQPLLGRLLPAAASTPNAVAQFRASLSTSQLARICEILGSERFARLLALDAPEKVALFFLQDLPAEMGGDVMNVLTPEQAGIVQGAIAREVQRVEQASKANSTTEPS